MGRFAALLFMLIVGTACDSQDADDALPDGWAVFEVEVAEQETFRIALASEALIAEAEQALADGRDGVIIGDLAAGDGGFNSSYSWHMRPETVAFVDTAVEVCDGRPRSDVESDLNYWLNTIGNYCPWGAKVIQRIK